MAQPKRSHNETRHLNKTSRTAPSKVWKGNQILCCYTILTWHERMTSTKIWRSDTFAYTTNLKYIEYDDLKWKTSKNMLLHYFWHVWLNFLYSSFSAVIIDYRFLPCVTFLCIFLPALDSSNEASCWTWFAATSCSFRLSFSQQKVALFSPWKKMCPTKIWTSPPKGPQPCLRFSRELMARCKSGQIPGPSILWLVVDLPLYMGLFGLLFPL